VSFLGLERANTIEDDRDDDDDDGGVAVVVEGRRPLARDASDCSLEQVPVAAAAASSSSSCCINAKVILCVRFLSWWRSLSPGTKYCLINVYLLTLRTSTVAWLMNNCVVISSTTTSID
jgi:hypothetical protein